MKPTIQRAPLRRATTGSVTNETSTTDSNFKDRKSNPDNKPGTLQRSTSLPTIHRAGDQYYYIYRLDMGRRRIKSILKFNGVRDMDRTSLTTGSCESNATDSAERVNDGDCASPTNVSDSGVSEGNENNTSNKSIEFAHIYIREYARTVGDNPSCSNGPPISISWEYSPNTKILTIEEYENTRRPRRSPLEMIIPRMERQDMLKKEWNISHKEIILAVRNKLRVKGQRRTTCMRLGRAEKVDEFVQAASRKILKALALRQSVSKQVAELDRVYDEIQAARLKQLREELQNGIGTRCVSRKSLPARLDNGPLVSMPTNSNRSQSLVLSTTTASSALAALDSSSKSTLSNNIASESLPQHEPVEVEPPAITEPDHDSTSTPSQKQQLEGDKLVAEKVAVTTPTLSSSCKILAFNDTNKNSQSKPHAIKIDESKHELSWSMEDHVGETDFAITDHSDKPEQVPGPSNGKIEV